MWCGEHPSLMPASHSLAGSLDLLSSSLHSHVHRLHLLGMFLPLGRAPRAHEWWLSCPPLSDRDSGGLCSRSPTPAGSEQLLWTPETCHSLPTADLVLLPSFLPTSLEKLSRPVVCPAPRFICCYSPFRSSAVVVELCPLQGHIEVLRPGICGCGLIWK